MKGYGVQCKPDRKTIRLTAQKQMQFIRTTENTSGCFFLFPSKPVTAKAELQYNIFAREVLIYVNTLTYIQLVCCSERSSI